MQISSDITEPNGDSNNQSQTDTIFRRRLATTAYMPDLVQEAIMVYCTLQSPATAGAPHL